MSEKAASPENAFKSKHSSWLGEATHEAGALSIGTITGYLGHKLLIYLGVTNPLYLLAGFAVAAITGYQAADKAK